MKKKEKEIEKKRKKRGPRRCRTEVLMVGFGQPLLAPLAGANTSLGTFSESLQKQMLEACEDSSVRFKE